MKMIILKLNKNKKKKNYSHFNPSPKDAFMQLSATIKAHSTFMMTIKIAQTLYKISRNKVDGLEASSRMAIKISKGIFLVFFFF